MESKSLDFEDEIGSCIDYVGNAVTEQYLEKFANDLKEAELITTSLKQKLNIITTDDSKMKSLKSECETLEALVKAMIDKDRRVLKRIEITKTHLNTESKSSSSSSHETIILVIYNTHLHQYDI